MQPRVVELTTDNGVFGLRMIGPDRKLMNSSHLKGSVQCMYKVISYYCCCNYKYYYRN